MQIFAPSTPGTYTFTIPPGGFTMGAPIVYSNPNPITVTATKPGYAPVSVSVPASESGALTISIRPE